MGKMHVSKHAKAIWTDATNCGISFEYHVTRCRLDVNYDRFNDPDANTPAEILDLKKQFQDYIKRFNTELTELARQRQMFEELIELADNTDLDLDPNRDLVKKCYQILHSKLKSQVDLSKGCG